MNKKWIMRITMVALASPGLAAVTNSFQIGGDAAAMGWNNNVATNSGVSPIEYSVSRGVPYRYSFSAMSNLSFKVTFTETNGIPVGTGFNWLYATTDGGVNDRRLNSNEVLRVTVSYSDPDNVLLGLRLSDIGTYYNNNAHETMVFSDGENSTSVTATANSLLIDYQTTGLLPLSAGNVDTWELLVSVDDMLGGGTNFTEAGLGAFKLEYIADADYIAPYPAFDPALYEFVADSEFDNQPPGASMTRSNSWHSPITITTIDVIGQDGTSATNGVNNKTNITSIDQMGINSVNNGPFSSEYQDFNPNEAWIVSFDVDVAMVEIDLAGTSVDTEMTISSPAFPDFVLLGNGNDNDGVFSLSNVFVSAGTPVTFKMTSTTNASDWSLRIDDLSLQAFSDTQSYDAWVQNQGLTTAIDAYDDDPDNDRVGNLLEFALGGDPLLQDAEAILPAYSQSFENGTNWLNYVYRRRINHVASGLDYFVGSSADLILSPPLGATEEAGSVVLDADVESVTNRVPMDILSRQFMQLKITTD